MNIEYNDNLISFDESKENFETQDSVFKCPSDLNVSGVFSENSGIHEFSWNPAHHE
jgi:hypothetical protein